MAQTGGVSRRDLFGRGLGRLLENRLAAIDAVAAGRPAPRQASRPDPDLWAWGGYGRLAEQLGPAARTLTEATGREGGRHALDLDASGLEIGGSRLPFDDAAFDFLRSCFGATHAPSQAQAVRELRRVVKPGGMFALTAWEPTGFMGALLRVAARASGDPGLAQAGNWGRFEQAYRAFGLLPEFEMVDRELDLRFDSAEHAWGVLTGPDGALGDGNDLREAFDSALESHHRPSPDGLVIAAGYVVITAREPGD